MSAELFLDGQCLFDLSQLLEYCTKEYSPDPLLKRIADKHVRVRQTDKQTDGQTYRQREREREIVVYKDSE